MKRKILLVLLLMVSVSACAIDVNDAINIVPSIPSNKIKSISFNGDNVTLTYTDNSIETADMDSVTIVFSVSLGQKSTKVVEVGAPSYYDMSGRRIEQEPVNGQFIIRKGEKSVKVSK